MDIKSERWRQILATLALCGAIKLYFVLGPLLLAFLMAVALFVLWLAFKASGPAWLRIGGLGFCIVVILFEVVTFTQFEKSWTPPTHQATAVRSVQTSHMVSASSVIAEGFDLSSAVPVNDFEHQTAPDTSEVEKRNTAAMEAFFSAQRELVPIALLFFGYCLLITIFNFVRLHPHVGWKRVALVSAPLLAMLIYWWLGDDFGSY